MAMTAEVRRVRPRLRRLATLVFVLLLPVAAWSLWDYVEARRLARVIADIEARNEPVRTLRGVNTYIDRPDNAARYYDAAGALLHREALSGTTGIFNALRFGTENRATVIARVRQWLELNRDAEHLLDRATGMEFFGYQPGTEYTFRMDRLLGLSSLAGLRTIERTEAGDADGAARSVVVQLRLARAIRAASSTTEFMAVAVMYPLSDIGPVLAAQPTTSAVEALQRAMGEYDRDAAVEESATHTRALLIEDFWDEGRDWYGRPGVRFSGNPLEPLGFHLVRPWFAHRVNAEIRAMSDLVTDARRPWPERLKSEGRTDPPRSPRRLAFVFRIDHAVDAVRYLHFRQVDSIGRMLALVRTGASATAIERFRLARGGALPASLDELVPAFMPSVPVDPYSGARVNYRRLPDGYVVYSVGIDGKDDGGGALQQPMRWGGPRRDPTREAPDIGVQVKLTGGENP